MKKKYCPWCVCVLLRKSSPVHVSIYTHTIYAHKPQDPSWVALHSTVSCPLIDSSALAWDRNTSVVSSHETRPVTSPWITSMWPPPTAEWGWKKKGAIPFRADVRGYFSSISNTDHPLCLHASRNQHTTLAKSTPCCNIQENLEEWLRGKAGNKLACCRPIPPTSSHVVISTGNTQRWFAWTTEQSELNSLLQSSLSFSTSIS